MFWCLALLAISVRQGETIRLEEPQAAAARMRGRTVPMFDGRGLMPVPATETAGVHALEYLDRAGGVLRTTQVAVRNARFRRQNIILSRETRELAPSPGEMERVRAFRETLSEARHWSEPFLAPVPGCMTSPFGVQRFHNGKATGNYHGGLDQRAPAGRPVRAVASGMVRIAAMLNIHGGTVGIDHGQGLVSIYLHMSRLTAVEGASVARGEVIGYAGSTGRSTAPHLHWALYVHGIPVNPRQWVAVDACAAAGGTAK